MNLQCSSACLLCIQATSDVVQDLFTRGYIYTIKNYNHHHHCNCVCVCERERETLTTSSRPFASLSKRLFFISRTLATIKTDKGISSFLVTCKFFLSKFPHCFRTFSSFEFAPDVPVSLSNIENRLGLYSIDHMSCKILKL
jgi:hypothetical protein